MVETSELSGAHHGGCACLLLMHGYIPLSCWLHQSCEIADGMELRGTSCSLESWSIGTAHGLDELHSVHLKMKKQL